MAVFYSTLGCWIFFMLTTTVLVDSVSLQIRPSGPYKETSIVRIKCSVLKNTLDVIQILKIVDGVEYEISTNDFLGDSVKTKKTYSIFVSTSSTHTDVTITILGLLRVDSGHYECRHTLLNGSVFSASQLLNVLVPPSGIEIMQYTKGQISAVHGSNVIIFREGEETGYICRIIIEGSTADPEVILTMGGEDITNLFEVEDEISTLTEDGLACLRRDLTYTYKTNDPNPDISGSFITCSAKLPEFDPLTKSTEVEVHYFPKLQCEDVKERVLLGNSINITCKGSMFPEVTNASLSWMSKSVRLYLNMKEPVAVSNRHLFKVRKNEDKTYTFILGIGDITQDDFGLYTLEAQNALGTHNIDIYLSEVGATAPVPTEKLSTLNTNPGASHASAGQPQISSGPSMHASTACFTIILGMLTNWYL